MCELDARLETLTEGGLRLFADVPVLGPDDSPALFGCEDFYIGLPIASVSGDPAAVTVSMEDVLTAPTRLASLQRAHPTLFARVHDAFPFVPSDVAAGEPVFVFLSTDDELGSGRASLRAGSWGEAHWRGGEWKVTLAGAAPLAAAIADWVDQSPDLNRADAAEELDEWLNDEHDMSFFVSSRDPSYGILCGPLVQGRQFDRGGLGVLVRDRGLALECHVS
jgi:hypothetical protein